MKQAFQNAARFVWDWRNLWFMLFVVGAIIAIFSSQPVYTPYATRGEALLATEVHSLRVDMNALRTEIAGQQGR